VCRRRTGGKKKQAQQGANQSGSRRARHTCTRISRSFCASVAALHLDKLRSCRLRSSAACRFLPCGRGRHAWRQVERWHQVHLKAYAGCSSKQVTQSKLASGMQVWLEGLPLHVLCEVEGGVHALAPFVGACLVRGGRGVPALALLAGACLV